MKNKLSQLRLGDSIIIAITDTNIDSTDFVLPEDNKKKDEFELAYDNLPKNIQDSVLLNLGD